MALQRTNRMKDLNILLFHQSLPRPLVNTFSKLLYLGLLVQVAFAPYAACLAWTHGAHVTDQQMAHHTRLIEHPEHHHPKSEGGPMVSRSLLSNQITVLSASLLGGAASYALSTGALSASLRPQENNFVIPQYPREYPIPNEWEPTVPDHPPVI